MQGNASVLGIRPPATVRIDLDGWVQDWPWECIVLHEHPTKGSCVTVAAYDRMAAAYVHYSYEHAHQQDDGSWLFVGAEDFTVTAGPPQPASVN